MNTAKLLRKRRGVIRFVTEFGVLCADDVQRGGDGIADGLIAGAHFVKHLDVALADGSRADYEQRQVLVFGMGGMLFHMYVLSH